MIMNWEIAMREEFLRALLVRQHAVAIDVRWHSLGDGRDLAVDHQAASLRRSSMTPLPWFRSSGLRTTG
jgi:hypothetical protein